MGRTLTHFSFVSWLTKYGIVSWGEFSEYCEIAPYSHPLHERRKGIEVSLNDHCILLPMGGYIPRANFGWST